eukprot:3739319-Pyramimonas_sp.AAC.1
MHAISVLNPENMQMLGVEMDTTNTCPTSRPMDWDESFAEVVREGVGASEVDGDIDALLAYSVEEHICVVPAIRPLLVRAAYGDSLRII